MRTVLGLISDAIEAHHLRLTKATPRGPDHLLLQMTDAERNLVAGQWFAERGRAEVVAAETRARTGSVTVQALADTGVLVQPDGADRLIPVLHRLVASPGVVLVAHRPESRGVVRCAGRGGRITYTKALRRRRLAMTLARMHTGIDGLSLPRVTDCDHLAGTMTCEAVPGTALRDVLANPAVSSDELQVAGRAVGAAVRRLHATPPPVDLAHYHDATVEMEVTQRWLRHAAALRLLDWDALLQDSLQQLAASLAGPGCPPAYVHGDLHDKQILIDDGPTVGLLDFDLAATGEPALDLANLLVHVELRSLQGLCSPARATACAEAIVDGYGPCSEVLGRLPGYALAARLRLAAVYAFRPWSDQLSVALLTQGPQGPMRESRVAL